MIAVTDADKARHARIERIAMIVEGQPVGSVQTTDVYFNERTAQRAEAIAKRDRERQCNGSQRFEGEMGGSLQRTEATQITTTQNAMPPLPPRTTSPHSTHRSAIHDNSMPCDT
ncbi:MAG: hypothetical protein C0485_19055 [Pirellula sp.]|nr:hypothetical protein [Pirellula sp.]